VKPEVKTVPVSKQKSKKWAYKRCKKMSKMHLFVAFCINVPNFALPAHKIMLVLGNNNLYTETSKQTDKR
jgi:hypothetical protein